MYVLIGVVIVCTEAGAAGAEQGPRAEAPWTCRVAEAREASAVPGAQGLRRRSEQAAWRPQGTADLPTRDAVCLSRSVEGGGT